MSLDKIEIPIPRLHKRTGAIALFTTLAAVIILSGYILAQHVLLLRWMSRHDREYNGGFEIWHGAERLHVLWLPVLLYRSPHHQLAIAASIANIAISVLVMAAFGISAQTKKNFGQHWLLVLTFVPILVLNTTALLYNFIEHGTTGRLDTYRLHESASPIKPAPYGVNWMDFESWSCGLTHSDLVYSGIWQENCHRSQLGRWLLLPTWFVVCGAIFVSWISFRGLPGWRGNVEEDGINSGEGRVRLV